MVLLIGGSSHTGKTNLSQKLMEKYKYPYLSIDHIKMGMIRSGCINISVEEDKKITEYLWPILREMIKTTIENNQNMIVEGCYIPFEWKESFERQYLEQIKYVCLIMTRSYIENHMNDIIAFESIIENRGAYSGCSIAELIEDNEVCYERCKKYGCNYYLIDDVYDVNKMMEHIQI